MEKYLIAFGPNLEKLSKLQLVELMIAIATIIKLGTAPFTLNPGDYFNLSIWANLMPFAPAIVEAFSSPLGRDEAKQLLNMAASKFNKETIQQLQELFDVELGSLP